MCHLWILCDMNADLELCSLTALSRSSLSLFCVKMSRLSGNYFVNILPEIRFQFKFNPSIVYQSVPSKLSLGVERGLNFHVCQNQPWSVRQTAVLFWPRPAGHYLVLRLSVEDFRATVKCSHTQRDMQTHTQVMKRCT